MNHYSVTVTDNIFQLIVDFWHMLLVNEDDDVGFSLGFFYNFLHAMFCIFVNIFILFLFYFYLCVCVCACGCVHD